MTDRFHIINLGCKVNKVEADSMAARLLDCGARVSALTEANVVLINTCTVTGEADTKSRKAVRRAQREAEQALVIICGCGATANPQQFSEEGRVEVVPNKDEALIRAGAALNLPAIDVHAAVARVGEGFNTRVAVKVQDGCDHACSYCIVPTARGPARSTSLQHALREISTQIEAGAREIVLTGIDLGSYQAGKDSLASLLKEALLLKDDYRLRLSSIELESITDEVLEVIEASQGRVCAHLHVPLQSGSDVILKAMNRTYGTERYLERIAHIRSRVPRIALTTDVIVGFPGETEEDYEQTLSVCRAVGFMHIHVFRYSKRPGTPAAMLPGAIRPELVADRAERLRNLSVQLAEQDARRRIGSSEYVLFESEGRGRSESYYPVRVAQSTPRGMLATMKIVDYKRGELVATECEE